MRRCALPFGLLAALGVGPAAAQEATGQPDRLDFGRLVVGGVAEGSVRVFLKEVTRAEARVEAPPGVRVVRSEVGGEDRGGKARGFCDLWVEVETAKAGAIDGKIRVRVEREDFEVPVRARVVGRRPGARRVLVCDSPFDRFSTGDATVFETWLRLVDRAGLEVEYRDAIRRVDRPVFAEADRERFDVALLAAVGLVALKDRDLAALRAFVEGGGRVVVAASAFYRGTTGKADALLGPCGLTIGDVEAQQANEFRVEGNEIRGHWLTRGVRSLDFFRPSPVLLGEKPGGFLLATPRELPDVGFVGVGRAGKGEVVAIGDALWWQWIDRDRAKGTDNAALLENLLTRPRP